LPNPEIGNSYTGVVFKKELLASVRLVVISLSEILLSASETLLLGTADADDTASTTRATKGISLFASTSSSIDYITTQS